MLDSLLDSQQRVLVAATVDTNGNVDKTAREETFITFDGARLRNALDAERLRLVADFTTTNEGATNVRITNQLDLKVKLGAKLQRK